MTIRKFGYDLELYIDPSTKKTGRQFVCKGNGGCIDLFCYDKKRKQYVVIELKNVRAGQNTFGQIANYVGWVQERISKSSPVRGLVISRGYDIKFESALKVTDKISYFVKGGVKLSNYGGIKLTTYHKNLLHVWTFFPVHLEKFWGINPCLFRSLMR